MVRTGRPRSWVGTLHTIDREHGFHPALGSGKAQGSALEYHSPLEGESARGRSPSSSRRGANAASRKSRSASDWGRVNATPSWATSSRRGCRGRPRSPATAKTFALNLAGARPRRRTRSRLWLALCEPPTAEAFAIRLGLLRLPLKGGVILGFLERRFEKLGGKRHLPGIKTLPGNRSRLLKNLQ